MNWLKFKHCINSKNDQVPNNLIYLALNCSFTITKLLKKDKLEIIKFISELSLSVVLMGYVRSSFQVFVLPLQVGGLYTTHINNG